MINHLYTIISISNPGLPEQDLSSDTLQSVMGYVWILAGSFSILMIMIASIKYVISRGDPQAIKSAKETIIYSLIGLLITVFGFTITTFIFGRLS